ncbi:MAG: TonB-dependent receptor plug domain-containing protein [Woeseiaceae bacterium]
MPERHGPGLAQCAALTAERRDTNLQDVPISVSSFSAGALEDLQVANIGDLQSLVPNLSIHVGDANNAVVYLRGVGQIDSIAFFEPGVGIYLDDVYLGRAQRVSRRGRRRTHRSAARTAGNPVRPQ